MRKVFVLNVDRNYINYNFVKVFDNKEILVNFVLNYLFEMMVENEYLNIEDKEDFVKENKEKYGEDIMKINNVIFGEEDIWFGVEEVEINNMEF
jgi:hypothetical protein